MIFDYTIPLMLTVVMVNLTNRDGLLCSLWLLMVSVVMQPIINTSMWIENYVIYAGGCGALMAGYIKIGESRICREMAILAIIGMIVQFSGLMMWVLYFESDTYMTLTEAVFTVEIIRLMMHGLREGVAKYHWRKPVDSLHDHFRAKEIACKATI